jgi:hypothetical protein
VSAPDTSPLAAIETALAAVEADAASMVTERARLADALRDVERDERRHALSARRGDMAARRALSDASARRRAIEDQVRHLGFALEELARDKETFAAQRAIAQRLALEAERAQLAEERLALARELDAEATELAAKMVRWAAAFSKIVALTRQLDEPIGRELPFAWDDLFSMFFREVAPLKFDILPPSLKPVSTFTALSVRFTRDHERLSAELLEERLAAAAEDEVPDATQEG